ncbi:MAG: hypothetical protein KF721_12945 [Ignavibacteriaceae bacterium]|nr:hypothetical protein [Ignavibacteriaceae bacterium]
MSGLLFAQNTAPVVTNVDFNMRNDGSKMVDITYDVNDVDGQAMTITIAASSDGGTTWSLPITQVTGAVGSGITNGTGKTIVWNAGGEIPNFYSATVQIRISADDNYVPPQPCPGIPTVTYAGKTYNTVQIGSQCWLKENLNVGKMIHGSGFQQNNGIIEKFCFDEDSLNCDTYGGLYIWREAMQYSTVEGAQGICPTGWHIPTKTDFDILKINYSNGNSLKEVGQGSGAGAGTNTSGFSALMGGVGIKYPTIYYVGDRTRFYSSTILWSDQWAGVIELKSESNLFQISSENILISYLSIRCIKD